MSAPWAWGETRDVTWDNAPEDVKERFALTRLFWFYRMWATGGPDGSDLDTEVATEAREASEWYGPILKARAAEAGL